MSDGVLNLLLQDLLASPAVGSGSEALWRRFITYFSVFFSESLESEPWQRCGTGLMLSTCCPLIQCLEAQCVLRDRYMYAASLVLGYICCIEVMLFLSLFLVLVSERGCRWNTSPISCLEELFEYA